MGNIDFKLAELTNTHCKNQSRHISNFIRPYKKMIATCKFRLETEKDEFDMPEDSDVLGQGPKFNLD